MTRKSQSECRRKARYMAQCGQDMKAPAHTPGRRHLLLREELTPEVCKKEACHITFLKNICLFIWLHQILVAAYEILVVGMWDF